MKEKKHSSFNDFAEKINNKLTDGIYYIFLGVFIIFCLSYFIVDALTAKPNTGDYYSAHLYLFIFICTCYSGILFVPGGAKLMIGAFKKFLRNPKKVNQDDIFYNLLLCASIMASVSFLIVDFSFFRSLGLRIPLVVAVNLFGIFKSYFTRGK